MIMNRLKLRYLDHDKIDGNPNNDIAIILAITIIDCNLTGFLINNRSSCNILYSDTLDLIGIQQADLGPYGEGDLLALNDDHSFLGNCRSSGKCGRER